MYKNETLLIYKLLKQNSFDIGVVVEEALVIK